MVIGELPIFHPHACIMCGLGRGQRKWFLDLGFNLDNLYNPVMDGNVYICNECWPTFSQDAERTIRKYEDDIRESEYGDLRQESRGTIEFGPAIDSGTGGDDQSTEPDDPELESESRLFASFFGEQPASSLDGT